MLYIKKPSNVRDLEHVYQIDEITLLLAFTPLYYSIDMVIRPIWAVFPELGFQDLIYHIHRQILFNFYLLYFNDNEYENKFDLKITVFKILILEISNSDRFSVMSQILNSFIFNIWDFYNNYPFSVILTTISLIFNLWWKVYHLIFLLKV